MEISFFLLTILIPPFHPVVLTSLSLTPGNLISYSYFFLFLTRFYVLSKAMLVGFGSWLIGLRNVLMSSDI